MSIKELFGKKSGKILPVTNIETVAKDVESPEAITSLIEQKNKFIPEIDFSEPENFAKFGSAWKYIEDSTKSIYKSYPYDGSKKEKTNWFNSASLLTNYVFEELYPKNTGFINFGLSTGSVVSTIDQTTLTDKLEYIFIKGGPNTFSETEKSSKLFGKSNFFDESIKRSSNLYFDGSDGVTVEFYLKKDNFSGSQKQCIFDLWNSSSIASSDYGRFRIEIHPGISGSEEKIYVSINSGSYGVNNAEINAGAIIDGLWHHYAIAAINSGSNLLIQLFKDGVLFEQALTGTTISNIQTPLLATIGSIITETYSGGPSFGYGKLTGSLDEFRYWKIKRTDKEISRYYFTEVYGGTNTDDANTDLGVYYKFNEGIFSTSSIVGYDKNVLDYSGRISNGTWYGYSLGSRETGSAIVDGDFAERETKEPVIYSNHPQVLSLLDNFRNKYTRYDQLNNASIYNSFASWITDSDLANGENLASLVQIMAEFFDEINHHIQNLPSLTDEKYRNTNPLPFAKRLVESRGLNTMELFSDSTVLENYLSRNEENLFEEKLYNIKNSIYQNIYNNLLYIYRSKGTEKSIRNLLRCFGVDTELVKINLYADDQQFLFEDKSKYTAQKRTYIDLNNPNRFGGSIYQVSESSDSSTLPYMKGAEDLKYLGNTFEAEFIFPTKLTLTDDNYFETGFLTCSLFGIHEPSGSDYNTWKATESAHIQVYAIREEKDSKNVKFLLTSSCLNLHLTTSFFPDVYTDQKWLLSYRIKHEKYPFAGAVIGADSGSYIFEFSGLNTTTDVITDSFKITASIDSADAVPYFIANKKLYLGAHRYNFTGSLVIGADGKYEMSDVQIGQARFWANYLPDYILETHAKDMTNHGPDSYSYNIESYLLPVFNGKNIPQSETLVLNWNFDLVQKTDNGPGTLPDNLNDAGFDVVDSSSGSLEDLNIYPVLSNLTRNKYPARGDFFLRNVSNIVSYEFVPNAEIRLPEILNNDDLVNILEQDEQIFKRDMKPVNHFLTIEKSMYQNISEEMLKWIGTVAQFNNLIGKPTNRYEASYKELNYLRSLFFKNVSENIPDFEKFVDFFKWIDDSVSRIIMELVPASLNTTTATGNTVESHILERNKYRHKLPTVEFKGKEPIAAIRTINELKYNWKFGHAPITLDEADNCLWWKQRQEKELTRKGIFAVLKSAYDRKFSTVTDLNIESIVIINKNPKEQEVVKQTTKFGSGEYLEIDIPLIIDEKDCNDK